ncbi:hypothetical protein BJ741DRAFT_540639, partial [Chytriomyces cf. hyalinus JEL632]
MPVRVRETALDCLQKLFARACLRGACIDNTATTHQPANSPTQTASTATITANNSSAATGAGWFSFRAPSIDSASPTIPSNTGNLNNTNQSRFLIDDMMHCICTCFSLSANAADAESPVQLQVLKVLLTAVTSATTCQVHAASLLKAVQTCFNVFLLSKNQANALTAKAALTQMVHAVFSRMERYSEIVAKNAHVFKLEDEQKRELALELNAQTTTATADADPIVNSLPEPSLDDPIEILAPLDGDQIKQIDTAEKLSELMPPVVGMLDDFNGSGVNSVDEMHIFRLFYRCNAKNTIPISDAYLVFRLLCRLSAETDRNTTATTFSVASVTTSAAQPAIDDANPSTIKTRCLALEMLLSVLNNAGPVLQNEDMFASLVKTSLAASIGRNAVTTNPALFELSLSIFLMLIRYYRASMKTEVEVLLNTVYLHILEMGNSTYKQKSLVLQGLQKVMENSQTLVDLYLNYDCDMNSISLFERILTVCTRVAQGKERILAQPIPMTLMGLAGFDNRAEVGRLQEAKLRLRGLVCLVSIVESLVDWGYGPLAAVKREPSAMNLEKDALAVTTLAENKNGSDSLDSPSSTAVANPASFASPDSPSPPIKTASASTIRKSLLKQGVKLFEEKPVKGNGATSEIAAKTPPVDENAAYSIACFLKSTTGLSKSGIGSYLGEGDAFCIRVMHLFVDLLDFEGLGFVSALRMFLQTFRLPGEAQKIDRLMEKFADRYCENNPDVFAKADTAYTLAFSVIMLNTDLHSAHIKNRMDLPAFLKNNRGINDNADLPDAFLAEIFNEIQNNEIIMEEEQSGKFAKMVSGWSGGGGATDLSDKDRMDLYHREAAQIQKKSQQLMNAARTAANGSGTASNSTSDESKSAYRSAASADLARPMFATASWPLIATFSQLFESASKQELTVVDLCLDGFAGGIRVASLFKMEMEREAFVTSLTKLTGLSHFRDLKAKNGKAIKMMLGLTLNLMETLDSSWVHIIKVISQMERLQLLGSTTRGSSLDAQRPSVTDEQTHRTIEKFLEEFSSQDTVVAVDRIFTFTTSLTGPAILQFFKAVCHVSGGNSIVTLKSDSPPRMYLLQKIVEIAHYNMHRIRYEWSQIWKLLQPYFVVVGCHPNQRVSSLAVDALRQLSMKFLEREELGNFSTQNEFLKSFERIMRLTMDDSIRHMILGSLGQV